MSGTRITGNTAKTLQQQSHELQRLIEEAQRINREMYARLAALRHAGDAYVTTKNTEWG